MLKKCSKCGIEKEENNNFHLRTNTLKKHLESLFEPWMNWNNWGIYNPNKWDDNNPATWTWQIDHIIPQSKLPYDSMEHSNFQKCWALENLRPLSAKQNLLRRVWKTKLTNNTDIYALLT